MTTALPTFFSLVEFLKLPETKPASEFVVVDGRIHQIAKSLCPREKAKII